MRQLLDGLTLLISASLIFFFFVQLPGLPSWVQPILILALIVIIIVYGFYYDRFPLTGRETDDSTSAPPDQNENGDQPIQVPEKSNNTLPSQTYEYTARRYGIGYERLQVECIIDRDGSAVIQRRVKVEAFSEVSQLDTYLLVEEKTPDGKAREMEVDAIKSQSDGYTASLSKSAQRNDRLLTSITISPKLYEGHSMTYLMKEVLPPGMFAINLTREQINNREDQTEYFNWNINRPTLHLSLRVYFPEEVNIQVYNAHVQYASSLGIPSHQIQREEEKRLQKPEFEVSVGGQNILKLDVEHPMIGLIYGLKWEPVPVDTPQHEVAR